MARNSITALNGPEIILIESWVLRLMVGIFHTTHGANHPDGHEFKNYSGCIRLQLFEDERFSLYPLKFVIDFPRDPESEPVIPEQYNTKSTLFAGGNSIEGFAPRDIFEIVATRLAQSMVPYGYGWPLDPKEFKVRSNKKEVVRYFWYDFLKSPNRRTVFD